MGGYVLGFGVLAAVQSLVLLGSGVYFLGVEFEHGVFLFFVVELLGALTALGLGILLSLFARNEFQVLQFIPVAIAPQVILGGVFVPVEKLPIYLELPARVMPVTYILQAMDCVVLGVGRHHGPLGRARCALWIYAAVGRRRWRRGAAGRVSGAERLAVAVRSGSGPWRMKGEARERPKGARAEGFGGGGAVRLRREK